MTTARKDTTRDAMRAIRAWHDGGQEFVVCPSCGASDLTIEDQSARPHSEWYVLDCAACGYHETLNIPLGTRPVTLD